MKLAALNEDCSDDSLSEPTEERIKEARVKLCFCVLLFFV